MKYITFNVTNTMRNIAGHNRSFETSMFETISRVIHILLLLTPHLALHPFERPCSTRCVSTVIHVYIIYTYILKCQSARIYIYIYISYEQTQEKQTYSLGVKTKRVEFPSHFVLLPSQLGRGADIIFSGF